MRSRENRWTRRDFLQQSAAGAALAGVAMAQDWRTPGGGEYREGWKL